LRTRADDGSVVTRGRHGIRVVSSRHLAVPWRTADAKEMDDAAANACIESRKPRGRVTRLEELPGRIDDLTVQVSQLRTEMRDEFSAVRTEMAEQGRTLGMQMRVLHEDVIGRLATLQEAWTSPPKRKSRKT
jgi:hypothetical protein